MHWEHAERKTLTIINFSLPTLLQCTALLQLLFSCTISFNGAVMQVHIPRAVGQKRGQHSGPRRQPVHATAGLQMPMSWQGKKKQQRFLPFVNHSCWASLKSLAMRHAMHHIGRGDYILIVLLYTLLSWCAIYVMIMRYLYFRITRLIF